MHYILVPNIVSENESKVRAQLPPNIFNYAECFFFLLRAIDGLKEDIEPHLE